jgi:hypothetical protein
MTAVSMPRSTFEAAAQCPFGRRDRAGAARVDLDRLPQGARQTPKARLDDVVIVLAVHVLDVESDAG